MAGFQLSIYGRFWVSTEGRKAGTTAWVLGVAFVITLAIWSFFYVYYGQPITRDESIIVYAISLGLAIVGRFIWRGIRLRKGTVGE